MKNVLYVGLIVLGTLSMSSCGGEKTAETTSDTAVIAPVDEPVVAPDTVAAPAVDSVSAPADSVKM
ncbi:MAG: hypothetical protein V4714_09980 [Bacteroidota bacterium]